MAIKRITTNLIQDVSIGTIDIANNAITAAKITDGNITTAKLADLNVTAGKLAGTLDLTGKTITVATATTGDSDTSPASTAFVQQEIAALVDSSPSSLNTLNELAAALGDDASFSTTVTNSIATKLPLAGGTMTGDLKVGATIASTGGTTNNRGMLLAHQNNTNQSYVGRSENGVADTGNRITFDYDNDKMQLDSDGDIILTPTSNVGIGTTSPDRNLHIETAGDSYLRVSGNRGNANDLHVGNIEFENSFGSAGVIAEIRAITGNSGTQSTKGQLAFYTDDGSTYAERMRIDSSGKVGIGITPKTDWHTGYNAIQIGESSAFFANGSADEVFMSQNARWTSGGWKYNSSGTATLFDMQSGNTRWRRAASGSNDGTISWSDSMFIDTSGHVGIGTTSPTVDLDVSGPSSSMVLPGTSGTTPKGFLRLGYNDRNWGGTEILMGVINDGNVGYASYLQAKAPTDYSVNRTFIINPLGGNLLVGTTSTTVGAGGSGVEGFRVDSDNGIVQAAASGNPSAILNRTTSDGSIVSFRKNGSEVGSIGASVGDLTIYSSTSGHSGFRFTSGGIAPVDNTGSLSADSVDIGQSSWKFRDIYLSNTIGNGAGEEITFNNAQDYLRFDTTGSERMRIDSSGIVLVGTQSRAVGIIGDVNAFGVSADGGPNNPVVAFADHDATVNANSVIQEISFKNDTAFTAYYVKFTDRDGLQGTISGSGTGSVSFNTTSDERLKENIVTTSNKLEKIKQIQVRDFNYIGKDVTTTGLIAQELNEIIPDVVREGSEDAAKDPWAVDYGKLTPYLIKAVQEQQTLIESLTARIETLEG